MGDGLRKWQANARSVFHSWTGPDFLVTATPGAGKTTFALQIAADLVAAGSIEQVIVVCPTDHLRTQWAHAGVSRGVLLDPTLTNSAGGLRGGYRGYVTTYAQVAARPDLHRMRVARRSTLVVFDEIHHAGDGLSWGDAVQSAFSGAVRRLALSGTPFRTAPGQRIPFVRYDATDDGLRSVADFSYSYSDALIDRVVRPVVFAAYDGDARWLDAAGCMESASLTSRSDGKRHTVLSERSAWRTALNPRGQWIPHVLAAADDHLNQQRQLVPDAKAIVLASNQDAAREYARVMTRVTGDSPVVILSDDPDASRKLSEFRDNGQKYAVCVRMISEGVDIPAATTLVFATTYSTPLFFAQAVGRVVRSRAPGESATVFLPAVRSLMEMAARMETERDFVTGIRKESGDNGFDVVPVNRQTHGTSGWAPIGADARFDHVVVAGRALAAEGSSAADDYLGIPGLLTAEQTAQVLADRDNANRQRALRAHPSGAVESASSSAAPWEVSAQLRRELNSAVAAVSARTGEPHARVHVWAVARVAGPPSVSASDDVLRRRISVLRQRLVTVRG